MPSIKATHHHIKEHNRDLVLKMIIDNRVTSRADIARETKLTRATVSEVVTGLMAEGLVEEIGVGSSTGGKPSILLSLVSDARYLIGVYISEEKFIGAISPWLACWKNAIICRCPSLTIARPPPSASTSTATPAAAIT